MTRWGRLHWYGHIQRMEEERWPKKATQLALEGLNPKGRPRKTWLECIKNNLKATGVDKELVKDRTAWRKAIKPRRHNKDGVQPSDTGNNKPCSLNMSGHNLSSFQQPQEGSPLTIVMPRNFNEANTFINQSGAQDMLPGITLVNHPIQNSRETTPVSCSGGIRVKDGTMMNSMVAETSGRDNTSNKVQQGQFASSEETQYTFTQFTANTGNVQIAPTGALSLPAEQRNNPVTQMQPGNIVAPEQGGLDMVNSLLGSCGQMATLNTQQGQVFNVVILGDPQAHAIPTLSSNILHSGNGVSALNTNSTVSTSVSGVPPGTLLLAVAPTPVNTSVPNIVSTIRTSCVSEEPLHSPIATMQPLTTSSISSSVTSNATDATMAVNVTSPVEEKTEAKEKVEETKREKKFACDLCEKTYYTSSHLKAHKRSHTGERPYICDICGNCYHRPETLSAHRRIHLGIKRFECEDCGKKYGYYSHLNVHIKRVHKKLRPYSCETCGKAFTMKNNLRYHQKIHLIDKPHKCLECGRGFTYPTDLNRHMRGHTGEKKFTCDICHKAFSESGTMTRHKRKVHSGLSEPGEVTETSQDAKDTAQLSGTIYECTECDKSFLQEQHLNFHRRTHHETKEKVVKCSFCPRLFETLRCARAHENRMHLLDRSPKEKYKCDICEELFVTKKKLAEHKSAHYKLDDDSDYTNISSCQQENGYYKCNICDREFAFPAGLIVHRFSHSNVRPYTCSECGQSFKLRRYLTSHLSRCKKSQLLSKDEHSVTDHGIGSEASGTLVSRDSNLIEAVTAAEPFNTNEQEEPYKSEVFEAFSARSAAKNEACASLSSSREGTRHAVNVDSLLEHTLQGSVASLGDGVSSSGLVHVIILSNKNCDNIGSIPTSESAIPIISSGTLVESTVSVNTSVLNPLNITNDSIIVANDSVDASLKPFTSNSPSSSDEKLDNFASSSVAPMTLPDSMQQSSDEEGNVIVESSSGELNSSPHIKSNFDETVSFSKVEPADASANCCVSAVDDVSSTVDSDERHLIQSSQTSEENVVVYLSF